MTSGKTRLVLFAAAALVGAVLAALALALIDGHSDRRDAAVQRFEDEAEVTASVIQSVFGANVSTQTQRYEELFGARRIEPAKLEAYKRARQLEYIVVLDGQGAVVATTRKLDPAVRAGIGERPRHVDAVVDGAPWFMSGVIRGASAQYVSPFESAAGRRLLVQGFSAQLISGFVGSSLASLPGAGRTEAYVVDGTGQVIASADDEVRPGTPAPELGPDMEQTTSAIGNTDWSVVLAASAENLFASTDAPVQWLVLIALAIAAAIALLLLSRALRQSQKLEAAYVELARTNADLERTNTELHRSNAELEQFASVASHDLQEPLRKVQTFGDQLERRHGDALDEEGKDFLRRMRNASARMSVLIDDLLLFSRVTTHAKPQVPVDLQRIAKDVLSDLETRIAETGGDVHIGPLAPVQADPTQMRQLLQNLIGNALKFHREGVAPVVRVEPAKAPAPGMAAFTVADNGIGFERDYEERIFRVFERLHPRDVYAGTGIGLALCRKIAERHGGSITGEGVPGEGARFTVVLPAARVAQATKAPAAPEPAHA